MKFARTILLSAYALLVAVAVIVAMPAVAAEKKNKLDDPLFAVVNGEEIRKSTLDDARALLPQELQAMPARTLYPALMNQIINSILIAEEARRQKFHKSEIMKRRLKRVTDQILERAFLVEYIEKQMTEKALKERYGKLLIKCLFVVGCRRRHCCRAGDCGGT